MLIELIAFLVIGCLLGTITGLIPGIHINLVSLFLVSFSASFLTFVDPIFFIILITSMAITHTFIDFIPSVFLGCPDTDTELSVLPGHELLKKGQGYEAVILTAYGSLATVIILILISIPSIKLVTGFYSLIKEQIPYILIAVSILLILLEKKKSKSLLVFLLSGILGWSVLNLNTSQNIFTEPLLPLLTGLFGASNLILSIKNKTKIPKQKITKIKLDKKFISPIFGSLIASPLSSFLPGLGSGQAAIIGNIISQTDRKGFLILLGATNTLVMGFSFITFYAISRTRTGAVVAINRILGNINLNLLIIILICVFISGIIAFFLTLKIAKIFSEKISFLNYSKISITTLIILVFIILFISKPLGLFILAVSTITGIYSISLGVRRTNMMGCLLLPTILFYLI